MSTKKKTYVEVKEFIENKGFKLLSDRYINSITKIKIECQIHGIIETTFKWFRIGFGCKMCGIEHKTSKKRTSLDIIKEKVKSLGYSFVSCEYKNENSPLILTCKYHGMFSTSWASIKENHGCSKCGYLAIGEKTRTSIEEIRVVVERLGYSLVDETYTNHSQKLTIRCDVHGEFKKTINQINMGSGCRQCGFKKGSQKRLKTQEQFEKEVESVGYKVKGTYIGSSHKIELVCPVHGDFKIYANGVKNHKCQKCSKKYDIPQNEIFDFIKNFYEDAIPNNRKVIGPKEVDIFVPSLNLAIEYCGLHWHNEDSPEPRLKNYHIAKTNQCQNTGVRLITIFEDEWLERKNQVKNFLLSVLNKNEINIFARKTEIKEVSTIEAKNFLEINHIQGSTNSIKAFGLYYREELVGIITGNKHHRQGHDNVFILNRLAFKHNVNVVGGSSKLLKKLAEYAKNNKYTKILSWSDNRWSEGNVYKSLGFYLAGELGPDYNYTYKQKRISKQSCQKKHLIKKGAIGNTESEMAKSLGYSRIWDCGKKRWELSLI